MNQISYDPVTNPVTIALKRAAVRSRAAFDNRHLPILRASNLNDAVAVIMEATHAYPNEPALHLRLADLACQHPELTIPRKLEIVERETDAICLLAYEDHIYQVGTGHEQSMFVAVAQFCNGHDADNLALQVMLIANQLMPNSPLLQMELDYKILHQFHGNPARPDRNKINPAVLPDTMQKASEDPAPTRSHPPRPFASYAYSEFM